jgi:hypothetical protein
VPGWIALLASTKGSPEMAAKPVAFDDGSVSLRFGTTPGNNRSDAAPGQ